MEGHNAAFISCTLLIALIGLAPTCAAQKKALDVVGVYHCKDRGGKECLKVNADSTFAQCIPCSSTTPYAAGHWDIRIDPDLGPVLALDSPQLKCKPSSDKCQLSIGKQFGKRFLIWGKYTFWETKEKKE